jgi:ABC-2 type transport system permease protein
VGLLVDAIDGNTAGVATGYAQSIVSGFAATVLPVGAASPTRWRSACGTTPAGHGSFMIPGLVDIVVTMVSMMMSSMALVKEKEIGTLEQLLVTPLPAGTAGASWRRFWRYTFVEMAFR